jgi:hypothetical protein
MDYENARFRIDDPTGQSSQSPKSGHNSGFLSGQWPGRGRQRARAL